MSFADYNEFIQRELIPDMVDTVVYDSLKPFTDNFTTPEILEGDRITSKYRLAHTSNAAFFDKSDVNPASSTQTLAKPYWDKVFSHGAAEVHGIDVSNSSPSTSDKALITDAIQKEVEAVAALNVTALYTQFKKDVDSTSVAYSDKSLSRTTYPLLVSYEEATNATITLSYMRGMMRGVTLNKGVNLSDYLCLTEGSVYYTFRALAAALHSWNAVSKSGKAENMGWPMFDDFEGLAFAEPTEFPNMTTGDVLMLRRQDVNIVNHLPLGIEAVDSGRFSMKFVIRQGVNGYVDNPYLNGKMTDKD